LAQQIERGLRTRLDKEAQNQVFMSFLLVHIVISLWLLYRKQPLKSMVLCQELLDTFSSCSYNPSNHRINLKNNVRHRIR
jgi:hypothetical protein